MNSKNKQKGIIVLIVFFFCTSVAFTQTIVRVFSQLQQGQIGHSIQIAIGQFTQRLTTNQYQPIAYVDFYLPAPGVYPCQINSISQIQGESFYRRGFGNGNLNIQGGEVLTLAGDLSKNPYPITLIKVGQLQGMPTENRTYPTPNPSQLNDAQRRMRINQIDLQIKQLQDKIADTERSLNYMSSSGDKNPGATNMMSQSSLSNLIQSFQYQIMVLEREKMQLEGY